MIGQEEKRGVDMAIEKINAAGGALKKKVELIIEDNRGDPTVIVSAAEKLITRDKVVALTGGYSSVDSLALLAPDLEGDPEGASQLEGPRDDAERHIASAILPGYERNDARFAAVESMSNRDVTNYRVARYSAFDPNFPINPPANGTLTELATTTNLLYNDYAWAGLSQGWYAYGVKALYTSGLYSDYAISNIVGHLMDFEVTVDVTLSTGLEPSGVELTIQGNEWPYETYFEVTPASGTVVFDPVWKGHYDIIAVKVGYDTYFIENTFINSDKTFNIVMQEKKYAPGCLYVDPLTWRPHGASQFALPLMRTLMGHNSRHKAG